MVDENAIKEVLEKALEGYFSSDLSIEIDAEKISCTFLTRDQEKEGDQRGRLSNEYLLEEISAAFFVRTNGQMKITLTEESKALEAITLTPEQKLNGDILQHAILTILLTPQNKTILKQLVDYLSAAKEVAKKLDALRDKEVLCHNSSTTISLNHGLAQLTSYDMPETKVMDLLNKLLPPKGNDRELLGQLNSNDVRCKKAEGDDLCQLQITIPEDPSLRSQLYQKFDNLIGNAEQAESQLEVLTKEREKELWDAFADKAATLVENMVGFVPGKMQAEDGRIVSNEQN
jgi:hypothetical protein